MKKLFLILTVLVLSACANKNDSNDNATVPVGTATPQGVPVSDARFPYQYNYNGGHCTTGQKRYRTRERLCEGLRNDRLNNNCAIDQRYEMFRQNCTDHSWQIPGRHNNPGRGTGRGGWNQGWR